MKFRKAQSLVPLRTPETDIPTELLCSSDLKNLGQLPVQEVLMILL